MSILSACVVLLALLGTNGFLDFGTVSAASTSYDDADTHAQNAYAGRSAAASAAVPVSAKRQTQRQVKNILLDELWAETPVRPDIF